MPKWKYTFKWKGHWKHHHYNKCFVKSLCFCIPGSSWSLSLDPFSWIFWYATLRQNVILILRLSSSPFLAFTSLLDPHGMDGVYFPASWLWALHYSLLWQTEWGESFTFESRHIRWICSASLMTQRSWDTWKRSSLVCEAEPLNWFIEPWKQVLIVVCHYSFCGLLCSIVLAIANWYT